MDEEQLRAIEERANGTTPGEWRMSAMGAGVLAGEYSVYGFADYDAAFIAHAREDIPALLAEVRSLRTKLDAVPVDAMRYLHGPMPVVDGKMEESWKAIKAYLDTLPQAAHP